MPNGVFRVFNRDSRPLSAELNQRFLRPLLARVDALTAEELAGPTDEIVPTVVSSVRVEPPRLLGQEAAGPHEGEWRPTGFGVRVSTTRYHVAVQVDGDIDLLEHWPNETGSALRPVDDGLADWTARPAQSAEDYDHAEALRRHDALLAQDLWTVGSRTLGGPRALYTFVDLTEQEMMEVEAESRDPAAEVAGAVGAVRPIVEAIAQQTQEFFDSRLPQTLAERIDRRKVHLRAHTAVLANLTWPEGWRYPEPVLEPASMPAPMPDNGPEDRGDVVMGAPARLADASFADVLRTVRVWAGAVERHPRAYRDLGEDRISDLLAATLNAALPGAHREVFSRGGRSDIYVRGSTLSSGAAAEKIFICECKMWDGQAKAGQALDQLFGYVSVNDTAALLLFYVRRTEPAAARPEAAQAFAARADFEGDAEAAVQGWPVFRFRRDGRTVRVCVGFLDLPDLPTLPVLLEPSSDVAEAGGLAAEST